MGQFFESLFARLASLFSNSASSVNYRKMLKADFLPKIPENVFPLSEEDRDVPIVLGGVSILGETGYICPTVTLMMGDEKKIWGWSLCLGNPKSSEELYFFDTSKKTHRGHEIPNTMVYYQARIDPKLLCENADKEKINEIIAYVLPHISDDGPPPASI